MKIKQKISLLLLAVAMFGIIGVTAVEAAVADNFGNPLSNYVVTGNRYGQYLWYDAAKGGNQYHAGEDLNAVPLTPVYAIADGTVKQSKKYSDGYGNVVVIEHTLPDGNKIVSIYGHLSRRSGLK